jgi:glucose-1-phosphate adenylyltransferase
MDYDMLIQYHREKGADATICTIRVPLDEANRFGIVDADDNYRIKSFIEKPANPPGNLANMGVYVFNFGVLEQMLKEEQDLGTKDSDFGKHILPRMIEAGKKLVAYPYGGYWIDVGTVEAYWEAHMDLLSSPPSLNLNDRTWVIHTKSEERPPVRVESTATIINSLITDGAVIANGALVERSILSPGVYVGPGAVVRDSILLTDAYIEAGARIERCIIDKIAVIGEGATVGSMADVGLKITTVGKNCYVPPGFTVGAGCILGVDLKPEDFARFADKVVPNGTKIGYNKANG